MQRAWDVFISPWKSAILIPLTSLGPSFNHLPNPVVSSFLNSLRYFPVSVSSSSVQVLRISACTAVTTSPRVSLGLLSPLGQPAQFLSWKQSFGWWRSLYNSVNVPNATDLYTLQMANTVIFVTYILPQLKKKKPSDCFPAQKPAVAPGAYQIWVQSVQP